MTRAEERGLEALPPRWRKTKDGKGRVDSALPVRKFYIRAYEQAEKDLALTVDDIGLIDQIMLDLSNAYATGNFEFEQGSDEFYQETLKRFQEFKAREK